MKKRGNESALEKDMRTLSPATCITHVKYYGHHQTGEVLYSFT